MKKNEVIPITCPNYPEFSVKHVYEVFKEDVRVLKFLPDIKWSKKMPNREFVITIISSLKPHYIRQAIENTENLRQIKVNPKASEAKSEISAEFEKLLKETPFVASKCYRVNDVGNSILAKRKGRTLDHLRRRKERKPRKAPQPQPWIVDNKKYDELYEQWT